MKNSLRYKFFSHFDEVLLGYSTVYTHKINFYIILPLLAVIKKNHTSDH